MSDNPDFPGFVSEPCGYNQTLLFVASRLGHFGGWAYEVEHEKLFWSGEVRAIHEVDADYEPDISTALQFYAPECRAQVAQQFAACLAEGRSFDGEYSLITAHGNLRRVRSIGEAKRDGKGVIIAIHGAFQDITEQFEHRSRLARSEATLTAVFAQSQAYQGVLDRQGRLLFANEITFTSCGYREEEEVGRLFWECSWWNRDPVLMAEMQGIVEQALAGESVFRDLDYFISSGEMRQLHFSAVPIKIEAERTAQVLVSGMDITSLKRQEAFHVNLRRLLENIAASHPLTDNLLGILLLIETQLNRKKASINLLSADGSRLAHCFSLKLPAELMRSLEGLPVGPHHGSCGTAAFEKRIVVVNDIQTDPLWAEYRALIEPYGLRSCWSLPIYDANRRVIGTFAIYDTEPSSPAPGELELVADCAHIAGIAIERAQSESQLNLLDTCIDHLNEVVMITDAVQLDSSGPRIMFVNDAFTRMTGYSREETIGQTPRMLQGPKTDAKELERIRTAIEAETQVHAELINYAKDGREYWVELDIVPVQSVGGKIHQFVSIERDITERKENELRLRDSQERFRYIARATSDTVWDWNLASDSIWWNDGLIRLFGYTPEQIEKTSASWTSRIHPDDLGRVVAGIHNFIEHAGEDETWVDEYRFRKADGSYRAVLDRGFVIRDTGGKGVRMVGGMVDVTAQREAALETARLNRALQILSACNEKLVRSVDEAELLKGVCEICVDKGGYRMAWVGFAMEDEARTVRPVANYGDISLLHQRGLSWSADNPLGLGPSGRCIRSGEPVLVEDVSTDPGYEPWREAALSLGYRCIIALPLRDGNHCFGLLGLYAGEVRNVSQDELSLLQEMANDLAFGLLSVRARHEQQRLQSALVRVSTSITARSGKGFYRELLLSATTTLEADAGVIAMLDHRQQLRVVPLCTVVDGVQSRDVSFAIQGTPCHESLGLHGKVVLKDLATAYPNALSLLSVGAEAYIGLPLQGSDGRPLGLIFLLYRRPIVASNFVLSTLKIFASRAGGELERQQSEAQLREQASLLDKARDAIIVRDLDHRILFWNQGAERLYGWASMEVVGQPIDRLLHKDTLSFEDGTHKVLQHGEWVGELRQFDKQGAPIWVEAHWSLVHDDAGQPSSILAINTDISARKASEQEIYTLAFHDSLTGLPNRQLLQNRLQQAVVSSARSHESGAILFLDLDNFKVLNDTQGHDVGDKLLIQVARRLEGCVRESDTVARLGGDEFVVMLPSLGTIRHEAAKQAQIVANKIIDVFGQAFDLNGYAYSCTPSIGVALFSDAGHTVDDLLKRADLAMYEAKGAGRNAVRFFDPEMQEAVSRRAQMEDDLRRALLRDEFVLFYQPQLDADSRMFGAEALIRWMHPEQGLLSPAHFIPVAEDSGLILGIGEWLLHSVCERLVAWSAHPQRSGLSISLNVSARQFRHTDFFGQVREALERTGANPNRLKLELTESQLVDDIEETIIKMQELQALGVSFSLDDFGTGYSSLSYLKRLPLSQLKIDPSFVREIIENRSDAAIVRTVIALGQSLGLDVIAEGVETVAQRDLLFSLGCMNYQGYLFSPAVPIRSFEALTFEPALPSTDR
ncbi:MAG: EAL domain-containing protein [Rhodocyclaceae bacterium]|nr:EAL domain-containing protein [Rhodocyclaceae bacterium]